MSTKAPSQKELKAIIERVEKDCDDHGLTYLEQSRDVIATHLGPSRSKDTSPDLRAYLMVLRLLAKAAALDFEKEWHAMILDALSKPGEIIDIKSVFRVDEVAAGFRDLSSEEERKAKLEVLEDERVEASQMYCQLLKYYQYLHPVANAEKQTVTVRKAFSHDPSNEQAWDPDEIDKFVKWFSEFKAKGTFPKGSLLESLEEIDDHAIWSRQISIWYPRPPSAKPVRTEARGKKEGTGKSKKEADFKISQRPVFRKVIAVARTTYLSMMFALADVTLKIDKFRGELSEDNVDRILQILPFPDKAATEKWLYDNHAANSEFGVFDNNHSPEWKMSQKK